MGEVVAFVGCGFARFLCLGKCRCDGDLICKGILYTCSVQGES